MIDTSATESFWLDIWDGIKRIPKKVVGVLSSRKFVAAAGVTFVILGAGPVDEAAATKLAGVWIAYIFGTAYEDAAQARG